MNFSNISPVQNKILCILVFCNSFIFCVYYFFIFLGAHSMLFSMKYTFCFFLFCFVFFCTSLISFCNFFTFLLLFFNFFALLKIL